MAVHGPGLYLAAFAAALAVSTVASLAGVYGAVLVPPLPDSVLGTPSPGVTPTNLCTTWSPHGVPFTAIGVRGRQAVVSQPCCWAARSPVSSPVSVTRVELLPGLAA